MGESQFYTLDELARMVAMTPRNVRAYATRGLIDRPLRTGRRAMYTPAHRAQLDWVLEQCGEGMPLHVIRKMIDRGQRPAIGEPVTAGAGPMGHPPPATSGPVVSVEIPAVRHHEGSALRLLPAGAYREAGDPWLQVSVVVDLPGDEPRTFRLLRAAHRLADVLGYVHVADAVHRHDPLYRMSTWHRVLPRAEAQALALALRRCADLHADAPAEAYTAQHSCGSSYGAHLDGSIPAAALEDVLDLAREVHDAAVRVGPVVVVHATTADGASVGLARSLTPTELELIAQAPQQYATTNALLALLSDRARVEPAPASVPNGHDDLHLDRRVER